MTFCCKYEWTWQENISSCGILSYAIFSLSSQFGSISHHCPSSKSELNYFIKLYLESTEPYHTKYPTVLKCTTALLSHTKWHSSITIHDTDWSQHTTLINHKKRHLITAHSTFQSTPPTLTYPHLTSHQLPSPDLTSPHITSPHLPSPDLTSPHLTYPHLTSLHLASSHLTYPHITSHYLTSPHPISSHLT